MGRYDDGGALSELFGGFCSFLRRCLFRVLSVGPIPNHFAFIMDGNRRYAKKLHLEEGSGHRDGFLSLMSILKYCYELGVKYVTIYAFSIDNFKRKPDEVQSLMDLLLEKIQGMLKEESIVNQYGIRVYFIGNLKLLTEPVRVAAEKVMMATANNTKVVLLVCLAYTSGNEIMHAVQDSCRHKQDEMQTMYERKASNGIIIPAVEESCKDRFNGFQTLKASGACNGVNHVIEGVDSTDEISGVIECTVEEAIDDKDEAQALKGSIVSNGEIEEIEEAEKTQGEKSIIKLVDVEKHMYMAVAPDPDILIRSSGETRLSNFLLWQTSNCLLYSPAALWPEIGLWHLVWAVLQFQRNYSYLEKKKKQS